MPKNKQILAHLDIQQVSAGECWENATTINKATVSSEASNIHRKRKSVAKSIIHEKT